MIWKAVDWTVVGKISKPISYSFKKGRGRIQVKRLPVTESKAGNRKQYGGGWVNWKSIGCGFTQSWFGSFLSAPAQLWDLGQVASALCLRFLATMKLRLAQDNNNISSTNYCWVLNK